MARREESAGCPKDRHHRARAFRRTEEVFRPDPAESTYVGKHLGLHPLADRAGNRKPNGQPGIGHHSRSLEEGAVVVSGGGGCKAAAGTTQHRACFVPRRETSPSKTCCQPPRRGHSASGNEDGPRHHNARLRAKGPSLLDVDLIEHTLTVRRATTKTDAGERIIPLNADAWAAILALRKRIKTLRGTEPQPSWYVFPHAEGLQNPDPTKPMSGWRTAWRNLTRAVQCPACSLLQKPGETCRNEECAADIRGVKSSTAGLRFHDLRHHAITELAESQTGDQVIM